MTTEILSIKADYYFEVTATRLDKCIGCNETIYWDSYDLILELQISKGPKKSKCGSLCASCYDLLDDSLKENYPLRK